MSDGGSEQSYSGRLELTWTNKDQRLLAHEDGSYEWLPPSDYRVAEVRLLDNAGSVGGTRADRSRAKDNLLIRGDALNALTSLSELPEFSKELVGKVKLAYLDPPFNTQQSFLHYDDALEHSVWLTMMRDRLMRVKSLLAQDGSIWVHCDDAEHAHLRVLMNEVFGADRFIATIVWENFYGRSNAAAISNSHNYIIVFSPVGNDWKTIRNLQLRDEKSLSKYQNPDNDSRGPWRNGPIFASEERHEGLMYEIRTPSGRTVKPPAGSHWRITEKEFWKLVDEGRINFGEGGNNVPALKLFLNEVQEGLVPRTWWSHTEVGHSQEAKREIQALFPNVSPFATPKPERLMQRVVEIGSNPGEVVLDCFLGSGTTAAVAHKMGRRWVGIEWSSENLDTFVIPRLSKIVNGNDPGGVTEGVEWLGGGGFRILDVAPSMFEADGGVVVLADWATNGKLAEATAAQLGFEFESDPPFTGRKGRTRLAVIDGLISTDVVELIAGALKDDERAVVCGTAVDPAASKVLRGTRAGSSVRKIPASILDEYRHARWTPRVIAEAIGSGNGSAPSITARNAPTKAGAAKS